MNEYFSEPKSLKGWVKLELDLSNYVTKTNLKNATTVDPSINWWDNSNNALPSFIKVRPDPFGMKCIKIKEYLSKLIINKLRRQKISMIVKQQIII